MKRVFIFPIIFTGVLLFSCTSKQGEKEHEDRGIEMKAAEFAPFKLTTDLSLLSENEKRMLPYLFKAAKVMDDIFWKEAFGDKAAILSKASSPAEEKLIRINYGPWERLNGNEPFVEGYGEKPAGAGFYPADMEHREFSAWDNPSKTSHYTRIIRNNDGKLQAVPYHETFQKEVEEAAGYIRQAAEFADDPGLKHYLLLRAEALLSDNYYDSDVAWMEMKNNTIDFVVGPVEYYEDQLYGYKAAHEAFVLVKDKNWSKKIGHYASLLPALQKDLPCSPGYKKEEPGIDSDLNVYNVIYYAGDCNAGSKTIAINLPNDEKVRACKGSRKLQLKNTMKAKFDKILVPIANMIIAKDQRINVKFDAFFENTMFHEVAHGLGMRNTIGGNRTVREALKETYSTMEEGKADILGLWCITRLNEMGEFKDKDLMDNFVTFMAGIFRSVRFGAASAHGKANMIRFYYFKKNGAFERDPETQTYRVNLAKMKQSVNTLVPLILGIEGDGDYDKAKVLIEQSGVIMEDLQHDLDRINAAGIPKDIFFEQGPDVLGL